MQHLGKGCSRKSCNRACPSYPWVLARRPLKLSSVCRLWTQRMPGSSQVLSQRCLWATIDGCLFKKPGKPNIHSHDLKSSKEFGIPQESFARWLGWLLLLQNKVLANPWLWLEGGALLMEKTFALLVQVSSCFFKQSTIFPFRVFRGLESGL